MDNRKIRALFFHIFLKVKRVHKVKRTTISDNLVPDTIQLSQQKEIMCLKEKLKIVKHYLIWIELISNYCVYNQNLSDKKLLISQIMLL